MSARVAEARRLLREAQYELSGKGLYKTEADTVAAAQVEATLALVEQQRLANIIALAELDQFAYVGPSSEVGDVLFTRRDAEDGIGTVAVVQPDVVRLLGIPPKARS